MNDPESAVPSPQGTITDLRVRHRSVDLIRPWGPEVLTHQIIEVTVETSDGFSGSGFTWTPSIGAQAIIALLQNDIRSFAIGRSADPHVVWPDLWTHLHEAGSGGITTIALAGLDLALWDSWGRSTRRSVTDLAAKTVGIDPKSFVEVYGSGVNRHYSLDELQRQAERWHAAGYSLIKMKVGGRPLRDDIDRVALVRDIMGVQTRIALDANQLWTPDEAIEAVRRLADDATAWIEEPIVSDDLGGAALVRQSVHAPLALGENLHTRYQFLNAIEVGACDIVQPNIVRVGGITPFIDIAMMASERGVSVHPHLLPELSGQLALAMQTQSLVENVEGASFEELGILAETSPVTIDGPRLQRHYRPGLGIVMK